MKIYLINPPAADGVRQVREGRCMQRAGAWTAIWTPISLAICAAIIRDEGIDVKLTDCIVEEVDFPELIGLVKSFNPDLAIINAVTPSIVSDLSTARQLKSPLPELKTAVIGIHCTALPEACLEMMEDLDFVIRGEPEHTVRDLAVAIRDSRGYSDVLGITYRDGNKYTRNPDRPFIDDLDSLPFPAWDLIRRDRYTLPFTGKKFLLVSTSRGCLHRCVFCGDKAYYGNKHRMRSPRIIVDELEFNKSEYEIDEFLFWSESFTLNRRFVIDIAEEIMKRGLDIHWVCNSRVDNVDIELLKKIKKAGCWMIGYGVESGVQGVLDSMRKGIKIEQTVDAVRMAKEVGLEVTAHCVLGFPGETVETINQTMEFVKKLDVDFAQFYCAVPFPGSELFEEAKENGWINTDDWTMFEQNYSVLDTDTISAKEIMSLRREAFRKFYIRPKTFLKTLRKIRSPKEFKNFIRMIKDFLTWI